MGTKISFLDLNIYHGNPAAPNTRDQRVKRIGRLIADYQPTIAGLQEVRPWWLGEAGEDHLSLRDTIPPHYEVIRYYRDEKSVLSQGYDLRAREGCVILFDPTAVMKLAEGMFWLSDTPYRESKHPDSNAERFAVWAKFEIRATGEQFYFYSVHLDLKEHVKSFQLECLARQMERICETHGEAPIAACGDFNLTPESDSYQTVAKYFTDAGGLLGDKITPTFPHWGSHFDDGYRIDYFVSKGVWTPVHYEVDDRVFDPETEEPLVLETKPEQYAYGYYSDHAPLYVEYQFNS